MLRIDHRCNSTASQRAAVDLGRGFEIDVRESYRVSHEPNDVRAMYLGHVLTNSPLTAVNVKASGITPWKFIPASANVLYFDMAIPDLYEYLQVGARCAIRVSEIEKLPDVSFFGLYPTADTVYIDFRSGVIPPDLVQECRKRGLKTFAVHPRMRGINVSEIPEVDYVLCKSSWTLTE